MPQLQELDLSDNLLSNWLVLRQLGAAVPNLACLNLTSNIMTMPSSEELATVPQNHALRILVLNRCRLTWSQVGDKTLLNDNMDMQAFAHALDERAGVIDPSERSKPTRTSLV